MSWYEWLLIAFIAVVGLGTAAFIVVFQIGWGWYDNESDY